MIRFHSRRIAAFVRPRVGFELDIIAQAFVVHVRWGAATGGARVAEFEGAAEERAERGGAAYDGTDAVFGVC